MNDLCQIEREIFFRVCRDALDNNKVHYATDLSSRAARQNFPCQKNLKLMETAHLRNFIKTPVFKDLVFWRLNERFMPNRTGDIFSVYVHAWESSLRYRLVVSYSRPRNLPWQKKIETTVHCKRHISETLI